MASLFDCNETQLNASNALQRDGFHVKDITYSRVNGHSAMPQRVVKMSREEGILTRRATVCEDGKVNGMTPQNFLDMCNDN